MLKREQAEQKKEQTPTDEEKRENRQINYFIMRYMWQVIRHRSTYTIYDALQTSRERYTRIINTGVIRFKKDELTRWNDITGINKSIFSGESQFNCRYTDKSGASKEIDRNTWKKLFVWRDDREQSAEKGETIQDSICEMLKQIDRDDASNTYFYQMCYYFKHLTPAPAESNRQILFSIQRELNRLTFDLLDKCDGEQLKTMQDLLKKKYNMATRIQLYRQEKNDFEKK